ncbi:transporter [Propionivibrio limicola]|uniref:transporter n=1 Tax=Propionivibrio limicola TaxID=167645 RepID=UPI0012923C5B|nr:transporter [Propionivibrio limicola]
MPIRTSNKSSSKVSLGLPALVVLAGLSAPAAALQPLITDDTGTQGTGGNQVEFSYNQDRSRVYGETERVHAVPVVYTYGVTDSLDLGIGVEYTRINSSVSGGDANGFANTVFGAKWRFFESEASGTSLAIKPEIAIPVSSSREAEGLGSGETSGALTFILSQDVPFGAIHFNAGVGRDRFRNTEDNPNTTTKRLSVAPVWDVSEQWKLALDLGVESAKADNETVRTKFVEIGAIYSPSKDVDLALGFIHARDDESPKTKTDSATLGVTWRF